MNPKGFFSSWVAVAGIISMISLQAGLQSMPSSNGEALSAMMALEQSSFERSLIEQNTDRLVEKTIEQQVLLGNTEAKALEQSIQSALDEYYSSEEGDGTTFYSATGSVKPYALLHRKRNKSGYRESLKEWKVLVVSPKKGLYWVNAIYSGGLLKNRSLFAVMERNGNQTVFAVPVGYEKTVVVGRP